MQIPRIDKVVVNMGIGEATADSKKPSLAAEDLGLITGQKAVITRARNSIATFKVREGMPLGAKVTLRKDRMFEFLDRLVTIALPRVRDFRGLNPKALMVVVILLWVLKNTLCFQKLTMIKLIKFGAWILSFVRQRKRMMKRVSYCVLLIFLFVRNGKRSEVKLWPK